jgi:superfamily I DNA/RNA helicase
MIDKIETKFDGSTLVVSRRNAPLVSLAYKLVAAKIPFILKGRDFGKSIEKVVKAICYDSTGKKVKDNFDFDFFLDELQSWRRKQIHNLDKNNAERPQYINLEDKYDSVRILYDNSVANNPVEFLEEIEKMFPDETLNGANTVTLCSIHKAKGLERDSVFVLEHNKLPFAWEKQTEEQSVQEMNLLFVALTRSKNYLGLVLAPPKEEDEE